MSQFVAARRDFIAACGEAREQQQQQKAASDATRAHNSMQQLYVQCEDVVSATHRHCDLQLKAWQQQRSEMLQAHALTIQQLQVLFVRIILKGINPVAQSFCRAFYPTKFLSGNFPARTARAGCEPHGRDRDASSLRRSRECALLQVTSVPRKTGVHACPRCSFLHPDAYQVASDSVDAVAAAARAREADITFLLRKLAAAELQLQYMKAQALLHTSAAVSLPRSESLHATLLHKAKEAEDAAPSREATAAVADEGVESENSVVQQVLPLLRSSCEGLTALHANICQVAAPRAHVRDSASSQRMFAAPG
jgi:hypothetical protein